MDTKYEALPELTGNTVYVRRVAMDSLPDEVREQAEGLDSVDDLMRLTDELRARNLSVFGIQAGTAAQAEAARALGLISLAGGRDVALDRVTRQGSRPETPTPVVREAPQPAKMVT